MAEIKKLSTELQVKDKLLDTSGDAGTSGQILSSTGTGTNWINSTAFTGGTVANATTFSTTATFNGDIIANTHIYGRYVNNSYSLLYRFGGLYLTWDSDSYGTAFEHSLTSSYGGTFNDSITLNSYNHIRFNIDSNNNNSTSYFEVGDGTTGTGNVIFRLDQAGDITTTGNITFTDTNNHSLNSIVNLVLNADSDSNSSTTYRNIIFKSRGTETGRIDYEGNATFEGNVDYKPYHMPSTGSTAGWYKVGTLSSFSQNGNVAVIEMEGHAGYNAANNQDFCIKLYFKTSNGNGGGPNNQNFNSWYERTGLNSSHIEIVWKTSATNVYDLYMYLPVHTLGGFYKVRKRVGTWAHSATSASDPGANSSTILEATQLFNIDGPLTVEGYSTLSTGNSGTFVTNDSSNYPRITVSGASAQLGLFRAGSNAGGMYIGGAGDGFRLYTAGFSQKLLIDQSGNATFAGNVILNSRLTFDYGGDHYLEAGTNSLAYKNSTGGSVMSLNASTSAATFAGNVTIYPNSSSGSLTVGRYAGQDIKLEATDLTNTILSTQDADENQEHNFILNRVHAGTGADNFKIQKGGTDQLTIDKNGNATFAGDIIIAKSTPKLTFNNLAGGGLDPMLTASGTDFTISTTSITPLTIALDTGNATFGGNVTVSGDLNITGDINSVSVTDLDITDKTITIAKGAADSAAADGAGIVVDGASASILYDHTGTQWEINKPLEVTGTISTTGIVSTLTDSVLISYSGSDGNANDAGLKIMNDGSDWGAYIRKTNSSNYGLRIDSAGTNALSIYSSTGGSTKTFGVTGSSGNTTIAGTVIAGSYVSATDFRPTNIVTNKVVKFDGTSLNDSTITDTGSLITLGAATTISNKLFVDGSYGVQKGTYAERTFTSGYFANGTSNLGILLELQNVAIQGMLKITLSGSYSHQNITGELEVIIPFGFNPGSGNSSGIWGNGQNKAIRATGGIADAFTIGDLAWNSSTQRHYIPIYKINSHGNSVKVRVQYFGGAAGQIENFNLTSPATITIPTEYQTKHKSITQGDLDLKGELYIPGYINHTGDSGTAIGFDANDVIRLKTASSTALQIDSSQNVKVVAGKLQISGDNDHFVELVQSGNGDFTIDVPDDLRLDAGGGDVVLRKAGTEYARLTHNNPGLHITTSETNASIYLTPNGTGNVYASTDTFIVSAYEGETAKILLRTDESDDNGDDWYITNETNNNLEFTNDKTGSQLANLTLTPQGPSNSAVATFAGNVVAGNRIQTAVGSAGAPAYTFSGFTDDGMYKEVYDTTKSTLSFATEGTRRGRIGEFGIWSDANVYATNQFRMFGTWQATNGTTGGGFTFANTADNSGAVLLSITSDSSAASASVATFAGTINAGTITGSGNATFAGKIKSTETPADLASAPTVAFGDGNTGFYERSDNDLRVTIGGSGLYEFSANCMGGVNEGRAHFNAEVATATNPTVIPWRNDSDTGIGRASANNLSLIAGGTEALRLSATDATFAGDVTISNATPALNLTDTDNSSNIALSSVGGALIVNSTSDQVYQIGGTEYFRIATSGVTFAGNVTAANLFLGSSSVRISPGGSGEIGLNYNTGATGSLVWYAGGTASKFSVTNTGNATFAGKVSVGGGDTSTAQMALKGQQSLLSFIRGTSGDAQFFMSSDSARLYFSHTDTQSTNLILTLNQDESATFAGKVRAARGTKGEPTYTFTQDQNTGMYQDGNDHIKFTAGGNDMLNVNVNAGKVGVTGSLTVSSDIEDRDIPCLFNSNWLDGTSSSILLVPFNKQDSEATVSARTYYHNLTMPAAGKVAKVVMKNVSGSASSGMTTQLFLYVNGSQVASSSELTISSDAITWSPTSSNTFSAGDELSFGYQKNSSGKTWSGASMGIIVELTDYDI